MTTELSASAYWWFGAVYVVGVALTPMITGFIFRDKAMNWDEVVVCMMSVLWPVIAAVLILGVVGVAVAILPCGLLAFGVKTLLIMGVAAREKMDKNGKKRDIAKD